MLKQNEYIKSLDGFRFLCFFAVFISHYFILDIGHLGVMGFFTLSGFLLIPILIKERELTSSFKTIFLTFFLRRSLRILPLYFLYVFLAIVLIFFLPSFFSRIANNEILAALTYTYNFHVFSNFYLSVSPFLHLWSLSVEEQMYLFLPFIFFFVKRDFFIPFVIIMTGLSFIFRLYISLHLSVVDEQLVGGKIFTLTPSVVDFVLIGGLAGYFKSRIRIHTYVFLLISIIVLLLGFVTTFFHGQFFAFSAFGYSNVLSFGYQYLWGYPILAFFFSVLLIYITQSNFLNHVLSDFIISYLGKISYGLYIYHYIIIIIINNLNPDSLIVNFIVGFVLTIAISIISYEYFEKYFLNLKDKFYTRLS